MVNIKNSHKLPSLFLKIFFLGGINSFALWSVPILLSNRSYIYAIYVAVSTLVIDYIFLSKRFIAAKYIVPGALLMVAFQIYPAIYTGYVAFTNFSVGHEFNKETAIDSMVSNSYEPVGDTTFPMQIARDANGKNVVLIKDGDQILAGDARGVTVLPSSAVRLGDNGEILSAEGYTILTSDQVSAVLDQFNNLLIPTSDPNVKYRVYDLTSAEKIRATLRYDKAGDFVENLQTGVKYFPNDNGSFISPDGEELEPGWTVRIGWKNFGKIFGDDRYRAPLVRVLIWTFIYPFLVVISTFFLGLFLALALNHPKLKPKRLYRTLLIVPYAMPGVLSILTWKGMLNEQYGIVNKLLPGTIPWLSDPWWAKAAVLLVQLWSGTPYMFLIATGAIQALSTEIVEAAEVDGASARKIFWNIKLPLVVIALTPLLIASYAYNFSNFGSIYLLTGGGPVILESGGLAGHTDILISYTYNLAFTAGKGRDYGLASAVSFINFLIVAALSFQAFKRSKQMENIN
jgi:arabinogalactan oligomer / maltooligosaccharide transport system permease protein